MTGAPQTEADLQRLQDRALQHLRQLPDGSLPARVASVWVTRRVGGLIFTVAFEGLAADAIVAWADPPWAQDGALSPDLLDALFGECREALAQALGHDT